MSGNKKLAAALKIRSLSQHPFFGPAPILEGENPEAFQLLLERLYADLKPKDIVEEGYLHDIAYWTWEIRRWRRMKVCLIEAASIHAMTWVLAVPRHQRLAHIGETDKVDIKEIINPSMSAAELEKLKELGAEAERLLVEADKKLSEDERIAKLMADFDLTEDTITTRAFLEKFDFVERFDRQIIAAENRRIAIYREIDRHRAHVGSVWREKIRSIEDAEFQVIEPEKHRAKKKRQKKVA